MAEVLSRTKAGEILLQGGVGILPTDTVYGIVSRASDKDAVARMYSLKNRENKPGTLIAASVEQLVELGIAAAALDSVADYWPNPLSIIVPTPASLAYLTQDVGSIACRVPADRVLLRLLERTGPLITSSANHPGKPVAETLREAQAYFDDEIDFYVDGGDLAGKAPSTIVKINDGIVEIVRQGAFHF